MNISFTREALCEALLTESDIAFDDVSILYSRQDNHFVVWCPHHNIEAVFPTFEAAVIHAARIKLSLDPAYVSS